MLIQIALAALILLLILSFVLIYLVLRKDPSIKILNNKFDNLETKLEERFRLGDRLWQETINQLQEKLLERLSEHRIAQQENFASFKETIVTTLNEHRQTFDKRQLESVQSLQNSMQRGLKYTSDMIGTRVENLTKQTDERLQEISGQVEKRLTEGFEKTNKTFNDIMQRLALIDEAQKKITELSNNVVDLQSILSDKRSRGAFGEVQLSSLLRNSLPENHFALQHSLSNGTRTDCMLFLPEPTGKVAIDAKFPLESYKQMIDTTIGSSDRQQAERQFRQDIKKHIQDIASKYIIPNETADGAVMFIPSEAIFAEIHSHYYDLVELAQRAHVWLVSPATMMAIITTARAVIKDEATRKQVHIIREHLSYLAKDFDRFQTRMDTLAKHIRQANQDVDDVNKSAKKISSRFNKIEKVELEKSEDSEILTQKSE